MVPGLCNNSHMTKTQHAEITAIEFVKAQPKWAALNEDGILRMTGNLTYNYLKTGLGFAAAGMARVA